MMFWVCALCGHPVTEETGWHDHHVIRRVDGGPDTLDQIPYRIGYSCTPFAMSRFTAGAV